MVDVLKIIEISAPSIASLLTKYNARKNSEITPILLATMLDELQKLNQNIVKHAENAEIATKNINVKLDTLLARGN